jgi:transcriptional regulator with XRE-family HTH domain
MSTMRPTQSCKERANLSRRTLNEWRRRRLSERLRALMDEKGLSVAAASKQVLERLPGGSFNPGNISHYRAGRSLPRPSVLEALSAVLDVDPEDLAPSQVSEVGALALLDEDDDAGLVAVARHEDSTVASNGLSLSSIPEFEIKDLPGGEALLQINQRLSWTTVIRILQALKGEISTEVSANRFAH